MLFFLFYSMPALRSAPGDENWDAAFGVPGVEGGIATMLVSRNNLYVGGLFSKIGGVVATNVARWDGTNWHALGPGLGTSSRFNGGSVASLLAVGENLYAGGYFTNSGSDYLTGVAKWNGSGSWVPVSTNFMASSITALAWEDHYLYAGGSYLYSGGVNLSNVARWDGTNWSRLGTGVQYWQTGIIGGPQDYGTVRALAAFGGVVYAGGKFEVAGGVRATNVARWNGTNWSAMPGVSGPGDVLALVADQHGIFYGGNGVQSWDGNRWRGVEGNVQGYYQVFGAAYTLSMSGDDLFVGGWFPSAGGVPATGLAKWNGIQWSALGGGISTNGVVTALATSGNDLFVAGTFDSAGSKPATNIARWRIPHELKIRRTTDKALLSWPATGSNLFLEATLNPAEPNWTILSNPPGLHGGECVVTNPITDPARFYRLRGR